MPARLSMAALLLACACAIAKGAAVDPAKPWPRHTVEGALLGADGARLLDADGDGLTDIVTGWEQSGIVGLYFNPGAASVKTPWPKLHFSSSSDVEDAVGVDVDGDGAADLVSCCEGKTKSVFVHWAPENKSEYRNAAKWRTQSFPACDKREMWMFCLPLQVDGKDGVDLVVGSKGSDSSVSWLRSPADPRKVEDWTLHRISGAGWIMSLIARDMDGDGDSDVLVSDRKGAQRAVRWLENPGAGESQAKAWKNHVIGAADNEVMFIDTGDIDGDGLEDIAAMTKNQCTLLRRLDKSGLKWQSAAVALGERVGGKAVTIADLDGDGKNDLVMTFEYAGNGNSGVIWRKGSGAFDGPWPRGEVSGDAGVKFDLAPAADIDGDGDLDVISTEENDNAKGGKPGLGLIWYENPSR